MKKLLICIFFIFYALSVSADGTTDYILKSDYEKAYKAAEAELKDNQTAKNYYDMCIAVFYFHDLKQAKMYCNSSLNILDTQKNPDKELKSDVLMQMGNIYSDYYKNTDVTFDYYNLAKEYKETNPDTDKFSLAGLYSSMGNMYYKTGKKDIANSYYDKALKLCNDDNKKFNFIKADVYSKKAQMYFDENNFNKAKEYYLLALNELNFAGGYKNIILEANLNENLAKVTEQSGKNKQEIKEYYQKAYELYKTYPRIEYSGKKEKEIQALLKEYPYDAGLNIELGEIMLKNREGNPSLLFDKAVNLNKKNAEIYLIIAKIYANNYSKEMYIYKIEAQRYIKTALDIAPYSTEVYTKAAEIYKILKMDKEAESLAKKSKAFT